MQIGSLGSLSTVVFQPYIYNTNSVSANSLNKISGISGDALTGGIDSSGLTKQETTNPLRLGESANFSDILMMQFQLGQNNAARLLTDPSEQPEDISAATAFAIDAPALDASAVDTSAVTDSLIDISVDVGGDAMADMMQSMQMNQGSAAPYSMARAINAYSQAMNL